MLRSGAQNNYLDNSPAGVWLKKLILSPDFKFNIAAGWRMCLAVSVLGKGLKKLLYSLT